MKTKQIIQAYTLKHFLALFDGTPILENLQLGDTAHPSSGFVDETILQGKNTIQAILDFPYSFHGLVLFTCTINDIDIEYKNEAYELFGEDWKLRSLAFKIVAPNFNIEINAKWRISKNTLYDTRHCDQECVLLATYKDYFVDISFYNRGKFADAPKYVLDVRIMRGEDSSDFENQEILFYKEADALNELESDTKEWLNKCIITNEN